MIEKIYDDFHIPYDIKANGWVNTTCPYCGDQKEHLGCAPDFIYFHCWKCGSHPVRQTMALLLHIPEKDVNSILRKYEIFKDGPTTKKEPLVSIYPFKYPSGTGALNKYHRHYIKKRRFDPAKIATEWGVTGTGPFATLDKIDYKNRIVIPIRWNGQEVSFQARDITNQSDLKYIACPKARERKEHQTILYGKQEEWEISRVGIIVEGVTDVWRLGPSAAGVFGIDFTLEQTMEIAKHFDRIFILFDSEPQAQRQARKLEIKLKMMKKEVYRETLKGGGDPGGLKQEDADHIVRQLMTKIY